MFAFPFKCERKVAKNSTLHIQQREKFMHSLYPKDKLDKIIA